MIVTLRHEWDMGHRLSLHNGKCRRLHGHHYVCEVDVSGLLQTEGPATGMVVDFYDLKGLLKSIIDEKWDHRMMLWENDEMAVDPEPNGQYNDEMFGIFRVPFHPTAENIAKALYDALRKVYCVQFHSSPVITRVRVYETLNGWAEVRA